MQFVKTSSVILALTFLMVVTVQAGQRGNSGNRPSTPAKAPSAPTSHGASPTTHAPKTQGPSTHGKSGSGPSTRTTGAPTTTASSSKGNGAGKHAKTTTTTPTTTTTTTSSASTATSTTGGTTGGATTAPINFQSGPVAEKLTRNTNLTSKLTTRLQQSGYTGSVYQAAYGFKNLGQFVAAVNVSQNLGVPFEQLKLQMTGLKVTSTGTVTTSDQPTKSLGQAIQTVKPDIDGDAAAQSATTRANAEIASTTTSNPAQF